MQYHQTVVKGSGGLPDELLYGRVGYLYSLVFINQQLGKDRIPDGYIQQVIQKQCAQSKVFLFYCIFFVRATVAIETARFKPFSLIYLH